MNVGIETLRASLRLTIHRGGTGNRPDRLSASYPVGTGETILSGMLMTVERDTINGRNVWVKGTGSGATGVGAQSNSYYIAVDDSTDGDVLASGSLQGLSVRGDYELSTSQFVGTSFKVGDCLTPASGDDDGKLKVTTTRGDIVIGHVVKNYDAPVDLGATYTPNAETATQSAGVTGGVYIRPKETNATDLCRIRFETVPPYPHA